jgi:pimeloyl-ACP methyl ester carboxylesterase
MMDSRTLTVSDGRAKIQVLEAGHGPDLVFFHGAGGVTPVDPFLEALSRRFRVKAPLLPGYGDSDGGDNFRTMQDITLLGLDILDALKVENPIVVGHSMGGMLGAEMAATAANDIKKLALIAPAGLWLDAHPIPDMFALLPADYPALLFHDVKMGERLITAGLNLDDPEFLRGFLIQASRQLGFAGKMLFPIPDRGLSERLYRIKAKTLLIWGDDDKLISPVYAKHFREKIRSTDYVEIKNAGHMVTLEQPDAVITALASLAA